MDYTVTVTPDVIGGPQTGYDIENGTTVHIPITDGPLDFSTDYIWNVNVTDGSHLTSKIFTFTTVPEEPLVFKSLSIRWSYRHTYYHIGNKLHIN